MESWETVYLTGSLGNSFVKQAISSGRLRLITPETSRELADVRRTTTLINRSRSDSHALFYALLFDRVIVDESSVGSFLAFRSDDDESQECRSIFSHISKDLSSFFKLSNSGMNQILPMLHMSVRERANLIAQLEPLMWMSIRKFENKPISREILRDIIDIIVLNPDLISFVEDWDAKVDINDAGSIELFRSRLSILKEKYSLDPDSVVNFHKIVSIINVKGRSALARSLDAQAYNAAMPVHGLSFGKNRLPEKNDFMQLVDGKDIIASVSIFLEEIQYWPKLESMDDVFRLRDHKDFQEFRSVLLMWVDALSKGDIQAEASLRKDIQKANTSLKRMYNCERIGKFFTYLGIPLIAVDALIGPFIGTPVTITSFFLQGYADWLKRKHSWLLVGKK